MTPEQTPNWRMRCIKGQIVGDLGAREIGAQRTKPNLYWIVRVFTRAIAL